MKKVEQAISESRRPPNPFARTAVKISNAKRVKLPLVPFERREKVRLGVVSLIPPRQGNAGEFSLINRSHRHLDYRACRRQLLTRSPKSAKRHLDRYTSAVTSAVIEHKADIVCVNELGFPSGVKLTPNLKAIRETRKLANDHTCVILAGSYHDSRTYYNTGFVFHPGCNDCGEFFHKQVSAAEVNELVSVPAERRTLIFNAFGLSLGVVVCLDLVDFSTVSSVVKLGELIDILFVPSYSDFTEPLERIARKASEAMAGIVVLVNHYQHQLKTSQFLYLFGEARRFTGSTELAGDEGIISIYEIGVDEFKNEKLGKQGQCDKDLKWLFGLEDSSPR